MLAPLRLHQVASVCETITAAREAIEQLRKQEPRGSLRAGELRKLTWQLADCQRQLMELWS